MEQVAQILKLLGDETRLRILVLLSQHPLNVSELTTILGIAQSGVSRHLGQLRKLGLLQEQRVSVWTYYQLSGPEIRNPELQLLWGYLNEQLPVFSDPYNDRARLQEELRKRTLGGPGLNERQLEPGQTWHAWSRLLGMLMGHWASMDGTVFSREGLSLLDLGCGDGTLTVEMARFGSRVIGVDLNPEVLASARQRMDRLGFSHVTFMAENVKQLPIDSESIDAVIFSQSLHHLDDPGKSFHEAFRVLKPGGTAAVMELASHDQEWVLEKLNHKWLGFKNDHLISMLRDAGFSKLHEELLPHGRGEVFQVILAMGTRP